MKYVIVDLEATCWENGPRDKMEIIEIGAVKLASVSGPIEDEFASFIKPVASYQLSDFCKKLTSIRQQDVDEADYFVPVFTRFLEWIGKDEFRLCSWGAYDLNQIRQDCARHNIPLPKALENHINLKREFARIYHCKPIGMVGALRMMKLPVEGTHHRGIDDARNIARIAQKILPQFSQ